MNILLTGATGFIGSHVARELVERGHAVTASVRESSDRSRLRDLDGRIRTQSGVPDPTGKDLVIGLAWIATGRYLDSAENVVCLEESRRLLKAAPGRVLFTGTCFELDTRIGRLGEESQTRPMSLYARCKNALREEVEKRPDSAWLRFFYQYGPGEHEKRFIPSVILSLLRGDKVRLTPGGQKRDYLYVMDVARAVADVAESRLVGCVNVGSGTAVGVREICDRIGSLIGRPDLLKFGELPYWEGEPMLIEADNSKLRSTGWNPQISLDEGLRRTVSWWRTTQEEGR